MSSKTSPYRCPDNRLISIRITSYLVSSRLVFIHFMVWVSRALKPSSGSSTWPKPIRVLRRKCNNLSQYGSQSWPDVLVNIPSPSHVRSTTATNIPYLIFPDFLVFRESFLLNLIKGNASREIYRSRKSGVFVLPCCMSAVRLKIFLAGKASQFCHSEMSPIIPVNFKIMKIGWRDPIPPSELSGSREYWLGSTYSPVRSPLDSTMKNMRPRDPCQLPSVASDINATRKDLSESYMQWVLNSRILIARSAFNHQRYNHLVGPQQEFSPRIPDTKLYGSCHVTNSDMSHGVSWKASWYPAISERPYRRWQVFLSHNFPLRLGTTLLLFYSLLLCAKKLSPIFPAHSSQKCN